MASQKSFSSPQKYKYVIIDDGTPDGLLLFAPKKVDHSQIAGLGGVRAAGEVKITNGFLEYINNWSGHYQPTPDVRDLVIRAFETTPLRAKEKTLLEIWKSVG